MRKDMVVIDIPPVLHAEDVCRICRLTLATLNRRVEDGSIPSPINGGAKRRRRIWSRKSIEDFLNGGEQRNKSETPTQRKQRANAARVDLERRGVQINSEVSINE